jgi:hypothetical protein
VDPPRASRARCVTLSGASGAEPRRCGPRQHAQNFSGICTAALSLEGAAPSDPGTAARGCRTAELLAVLAPATRAVPPEEALVRVEAFVDAAPVVPRAVALLAVATSARAERAVPPATSPELRLRDAEAEAAPEARVASRARVPPPLPVASLGGGRRTSSDIVARACVVWASRSPKPRQVNATRNAFGVYRLEQQSNERSRE